MLHAKRIIIAVVFIFLQGCTSYYEDRGEYFVDSSVTSQGKNERVRYIIIHYTATDDDTSLNLLTKGDVSAHYFIPTRSSTLYEKPVVRQLVPDDKRAWHAGISQWGERRNINDTSIGIEIVNPGFTENNGQRKWYHYQSGQIDLLTRLLKDLTGRYDIAPENVLGHSDVSPGRKFDPGPMFPWHSLAQQGIGAWPDENRVQDYLSGRDRDEESDVLFLQSLLKAYGYTISEDGVLDQKTRDIISSFQMHFRPGKITGEPDAETEAIANALVEKYKK
ncbi:N-acetylmuramoyl-L-alanine amidase [Enterobacter sp. WCHEn045836]|uniref:N-acetylmuramoyl-L-alanine amidase n=1 Tax=Enterobacter sp. WCHEn045836 TaxID=2497434 RepID=UPI000F832FD9|nr:N-acetylmuramoyl-L-alanine amidase [Enterobacter sp. WCHEn045836]RTP97271.1 N-acetylmuramoyl-L-alanine amidase [Enterobacter sp. WCHEn045836]